MQENVGSKSQTPPQNILTQGYVVAVPATDNEDDISLIDVCRIFVRYKMIFLLAVIISMLISTIYAFYATPIYRAEVVMTSAVNQKESGGLSSLSGQLSGVASIVGVQLGGSGNSSTSTKLAILKSREFTEEYIRNKELLPILFEDLWDSKNKKWLTKGDQKPPSLWRAYEIFNKIRIIKEDMKTGIVTLMIEWKDPVQATIWANELVVLLNKYLKDQAIEDGKLKLAYLNDQLNKTSVVEVQQLLSTLIEQELRNSIMANVSDEYAFRIIDPAVVPEERFSPKRKMIVSLGLVFGVLSGIFMVFLLNFANNLKSDTM